MKILSTIEFPALMLLGLALPSQALPATPIWNDAQSVCARQVEHAVTSDGEPVVLCEQIYSDSPHVRISDADDLSHPDDLLLFAAVHPDTFMDFRLVDRLGKEYAVIDGSGKPTRLWDDAPEELAPGMRLPSYRYLFLIYEIHGRLSAPVVGADGRSRPAIRIAHAIPRILISGDAIDQYALGNWVGVVSSYLKTDPVPMYDPNDLHPLQVSFSGLGQPSYLPMWKTGSTLMDGVVHELQGKITNLTQSSLSPGGSILPALGSLGERNPFPGVEEVTLKMTRAGAMHAAGDADMGLEFSSVDQPGQVAYGMVQVGPLSPAAFIQREPSDEWSVIDIYPHTLLINFTMRVHHVQ